MHYLRKRGAGEKKERGGEGCAQEFQTFRLPYLTFPAPAPCLDFLPFKPFSIAKYRVLLCNLPILELPTPALSSPTSRSPPTRYFPGLLLLVLWHYLPQ